MEKIKICIPYCEPNRKKKITIMQLLFGYSGFDRNLLIECTLMFINGNDINIEVEKKNSNELLHFFNLENVEYEIFE
jgi:hypothetical protein